MPPTFIYFVALLVWIPFACLVWFSAGVMALNRGTRRKGLALALAMAATFPCVFLFQAAAAPLIAAMVVGVAWLSGILDPASTVTHVTTNGLVIATISGTMLLAFVTMLTVSIVGFFLGLAAGVALRSRGVFPRCDQARTDGSSPSATGVQKAAPRFIDLSASGLFFFFFFRLWRKADLRQAGGVGEWRYRASGCPPARRPFCFTLTPSPEIRTQ